MKLTTGGVGYGSCGSAETVHLMWIELDSGGRKARNTFDITLHDDCKVEETLEIDEQKDLLVIGEWVFVPKYLYDKRRPDLGLQDVQVYK